MRTQRPGDPRSPRFVSARTGPAFGVSDHDGAVRDLVKDTGMAFVSPPRLEPLEAWKGWDGRDMRVAFAETRLGGGPGVAFVLISQMPGSDQFAIYALEMPEATFRAWGGAPRMMVLREVIPSVDVFPAERRAQIAAAPLDGQTKLYEGALDAFYEQGVASLMMMSQAQTLMMMQELNYDLLLGGDISSPIIAD